MFAFSGDDAFEADVRCRRNQFAFLTPWFARSALLRQHPLSENEMRIV
jgi:hypothetical protein